MSNAESDMKTFVALRDCSDRHAIEILTLVHLVQTVENKPSYISTQPVQFEGDWGISFFKKWKKVFKVDLFIHEGKMKCTDACNLEKKCQVFMDSFNFLDLDGDDKIQNKMF